MQFEFLVRVLARSRCHAGVVVPFSAQVFIICTFWDAVVVVLVANCSYKHSLNYIVLQALNCNWLCVCVILLAFLRLGIHHLTELFQDSLMQHLILHEPDTKVMYENYIGCLSTEAETMVDMTETGILPACAKDLQQVNGSGNSKFVTTRKVAYEAVVDEPFVWTQGRFVQSWCSSFLHVPILFSVPISKKFGLIPEAWEA